ncbi:TonB-dependent receptor [Flavobacterium sp. MXW15]|uniref:TonB-dependent receptor n=1 Tax=Xanthomonas chitinilytica TaxID=2989819 RepID=A0ABT3JWM0_9XANT|nr:TonB-dependent receptor [Xanthomonas sp. H13-6]MCW4455628.1 TonB-dependent receptor [Flavobacterium sp. MXW15]MCW4472886.1 TonB-dependent receptor [Xanthomonas sp. H13-6]
MRLKRSKLRDAIIVSLAVGTFTAAGMSAAMAQDAGQTDSQATNLDTVTVTGSRIKSQTMTESAPVMEISAEEFKQFGATTVEDLVNQYPQVDLNFDNFANNGSYGHAYVSLRKLGPERTLTLVNGRRLPASRNEITDTSIIPAALIKRVDILTGGASAIYGADAVAGVVNFVLDDKFEGVSLNYGYSAYQHNNDNKALQELNEEAGFPYPTGNSGFDGISRNADLVIGSSFAGNRGHAVGWLTWRENDALYQGQRDYSACSVWYDWPECGGSGTANPGRFTVNEYANGAVVPWPTGTNANYVYNGSGYENGLPIYNYAPINFYQRPDKRVTAGFAASYEINDNFTPYIEAMFLERRSEMQIAESGAFGVPVNMDCTNPLIGSLCADAGVTTDQARITLWKRNVEGGPRIHLSDDSTYRFTAGVKGMILDSSWTYDISGVTGRTKTIDIGKNDFLITRIASAATGCNDPVYGTFPGCTLWDIWNDNISTEAADAMAGTSFSIYKTSYTALSAEANGYLGWAFPSADGEEIALAVGVERRDYSYRTEYDGDSAAGNFAGAGAADLPVDASNSVTDYFVEAALPVFVGSGSVFNRFDASLGYRYSDDDTSGSNDTYKVGLSGLFWDSKLLVRAGYNRAVRAPSLNDMYYTQRIALNAGGADLCAGPSPSYTAAQCALTGLPTSVYGNVPANPANQYYNVTGGNPDLKPEVADTWSVGFAVEPIKDLNIALDWYNIKIKDAIGGIGYNTIQILCMEQGLYCDRIKRDARSGDYDLWIGMASDPESGHIVNLPDNIGIDERSGIDLSVSYGFDLGPGRLNTSLVGNYVLKEYTQTLAAESSTGYECRGLVNDSYLCQAPKWRHIASARYSWDRYSVNLRWRFINGMDYKDVDGSRFTQDDRVIWIDNGVPSYSYFDLSGSVSIGPALVSVGVNNLFDKEPPFVGDSGLAANANALGGYDQVGRYIFGSVTVKF